jgi:hypothetical protein
MSGALAELIAAASDGQLRATRRLVHRAYLSRDRLGWPTLNPFESWRGLFSDRRQPVIHDLGEPDILLAACLEISAELVRRGAALACLPCEAQLAPSLVGRLPANGPEPVASSAASGTGG